MRTKKGIVVKANEFLEYSYMKRAAEGGLVEAQHNLGVMYQEGAVILEQGKKTIDEFRSLTWYHLITNFRYIKAATRGYAESAVNAIQILTRGTADGSIQPNKATAMICLERIRKSNPEMNLKLLDEKVSNMSN